MNGILIAITILIVTVLAIGMQWLYSSNKKLSQQIEHLKKEKDGMAQNSAMQEKARLMEHLLDSLPIPVSVKDMNARSSYVLWNKKATHLFGLSQQEAITKAPELLSPEIYQAFIDTDRKAMQNGECQEECKVKLEDGSIHTLLFQKKVVTGKDAHKWMISTALDLTQQEQQRIELSSKDKHLKEALAKAEESNRLKSEFIANISHEIRTPLNAIVGFCDLLQGSDDAEERKTLSEAIHTNSRKLTELIEGILQLARIETGETELNARPINLSQLINQMLNGGQWAGRPELKSCTEFPEQDYVIDCDRKALTTILDNFISNAIKFTNSGTITVGYSVSIHKVKLFVQDTGIGIAKDKQDLVFNRFEKNGSMIPGIGLGLAICKALTERLDGNIGVDSVKEKGSTFWVELPCKPRPMTEENSTMKRFYSVVKK